MAVIIRNNNDNPIIDLQDMRKRLSVLAQNEAAIFFLFCDGIELPAEDLKSLLDSYPQKAIFLFTDDEYTAVLNNQNNVMPVLNLESNNFTTISENLRNQRRLFGGYCQYSDDNADNIISSAFLDKVKENGSFFLFLLEDNSCSQEIHERVSAFSFEQKRKPTHPIFITELFGDLKWLNSVTCKT